MNNLLAIEWLKIKRYRTFWILGSLFVVLLPVCFYIGYFGAGAGFLIMTALALFGLEKMHELNALKVTAACISNLAAG